jgi:hypothetical protein
MSKTSSRIDPHDTLLLFVDLQAEIFELSQTISGDRLKKGVLGLAKLAKIFGMPAVVSGVAGEDGMAPRMIPQLADGLGEYVVHHANAPASKPRGAVGRQLAEPASNVERLQCIQPRGASTISRDLPNLLQLLPDWERREDTGYAFGACKGTADSRRDLTIFMRPNPRRHGRSRRRSAGATK